MGIILLAVCILFLASVCLGSDDKNPFSPWEFNRKTPKSDQGISKNKDISLPAHMLAGSVKVFINYISRVDGDRCQMYPTCSSYSLQAIEKHGFFGGIVMTADRLIHESNEMDYADVVEIGGRLRFYDPVSNNDFWWYK
jgi:hypothetical protein